MTTGARIPARFANVFCALATTPACRGVRSSDPLEKTDVTEPSSAIAAHNKAIAAGAADTAGVNRRQTAETE
jgi:hypothetical protein